MIHILSEKRGLHRGATCQCLFSPTIRTAFPNKDNNVTSECRVVSRSRFSRLNALAMRSESESFEILYEIHMGNQHERQPQRSGESSRHVNARIPTSSWFPWVPSWFSSHLESPSRPRCSPPKLALPERIRLSDSTD